MEHGASPRSPDLRRRASPLSPLRSTVGSIAFSAYVHAERQLLVIEGLAGSGGERHTALGWTFRPAPALPPGLFREVKDPVTGFTRFSGALPPPSYTPNPDPGCSGNPAKGSCAQALLASEEGRGWVTAWQETTAGGLLVAITSDIPVRVGIKPKTIRAAAEAAAVLASATAALGTQGGLSAGHVRWWADFYWSDSSGSFLSLPAAGGARIEQFHWIQAFKIGCENACRRFVDSAFEAGVLDNCMLVRMVACTPASSNLPSITSTRAECEGPRVYGLVPILFGCH